MVHLTGTPFFPQREASAPFLMDQCHPFEGKNKFPPNLQKGVPTEFHKMKLPPNLTVQKYQTKYTNQQMPVTYQYQPNCQ
jgi:hypothetical protein